jgi:hypothetical protein
VSVARKSSISHLCVLCGGNWQVTNHSGGEGDYLGT